MIARTEQDQEQILKTRALELARETDQAKAAEPALHIVEFVVGHERYGIEFCYVSEIAALKELTPVPCTPSFVRGIINLHGQILSVIDLQKFFGLAENGLTDLNKVLILQSDSMQFGILADAIIGTASIPVSQLLPLFPTRGSAEKYFRSTTKERAVILNAAKLLSDNKLIVHEKVTA